MFEILSEANTFLICYNILPFRSFSNTDDVFESFGSISKPVINSCLDFLRLRA